ncbi:hypothetical protein T492DRAFT_890705 [Pavlovales sp. CCMP2436]|nr:hypothetical protein T492DRAFT_890705 [Pavlovales sp. CCMP2436]
MTPESYRRVHIYLLFHKTQGHIGPREVQLQPEQNIKVLESLDADAVIRKGILKYCKYYCETENGTAVLNMTTRINTAKCRHGDIKEDDVKLYGCNTYRRNMADPDARAFRACLLLTVGAGFGMRAVAALATHAPLILCNRCALSTPLRNGEGGDRVTAGFGQSATERMADGIGRPLICFFDCLGEAPGLLMALAEMFKLIDTIGTIATRGHAQLLLARLSALAPIAAQRGNTTNSNQQIISLNALARAHYRRSIDTRGGAQASAAD